MSDMHMHPASARSTAPGRSDALVHVRTNELTYVQQPPTPHIDRAEESDAHARVARRALAYLKPCDGCGREIAMVICRDRRWRPFETRRIEPAAAGVWSWRKGIGMEEQDLFPGYGIHYCADYHNRAFQFTGNRADGGPS